MTSVDILERLRQALGSQYEVHREIGHGGMATVFLAEDRKHQRQVALKVLNADLAETLGPERFRREITFAAQLQHPHILTVLDSGETPDGLLWFTMPYVEGESLRARLVRDRQLSLDDAIRITREVAQALEFAHWRGVIHRDVKPENILLTTDDQALVADFGIARALTGHTGEHTLTGTGIAIGTPAYMSPEQASGDRHLDVRSDVYALGAVCYEMLAGEAPFTGPTPQVMLAKALSGDVPSVRSGRPGVPEGVDLAIQKALSMVPADRFATATQFSQALEAAHRQTTSGATTAPQTGGRGSGRAPAMPARGGRRFPAGLALLGLGFLFGVGALFAWRSHGAVPVTTGPVRVAVLPFENIGDTSDAYFADGLTDAIRGKLTTVPGLAVVAAASSGQYRHTDKTPQQIAQELGGVRYLLVGKVRWAKAPGGQSRMQVSPSLIDVTNGTDVWQQPFDAPLEDVFAVQSDIAGRVVQSLGVALSTGARQNLAERPTANLAAYDAYLKGEEMSVEGTAGILELERAAKYYEQAIALDSNFASAWARLGMIEAAMVFTASPTRERDSLAREATDRSSALAPGQPETYMARAYYDAYVQADNQRALAEFRAGIRTAPSNALLWAALALAEQNIGQWDSALAHLRQAQYLDPRDAPTARRLATTYMWLRRYGEASAATDRALGLSPSNSSLIEGKSIIALARGDLASAQAAMRAAPPSIDSVGLAAFYANYWDFYWVPDDGLQQAVLMLPPAAFGGDRGPWAIVRTEIYARRGDVRRSRIYADSAVQALREALRASPQDWQSHALLGVMYGYLGRKPDAIREGEEAARAVPILAGRLLRTLLRGVARADVRPRGRAG